MKLRPTATRFFLALILFPLLGESIPVNMKQVTGTAPLSIKLLYFKASRDNSNVLLEWKITEEEDNSFVEIQRSKKNSYWETVTRIPLAKVNQDKVYTYTDQIEEKGEYVYQLRVISCTGRATYSPSRKVYAKGTGINVIYPNPAKDYIIVENADDPESLTITNTNGQQFKMPAEKEGTNAWRFNITQLPKGIYFLRAGKQVIRFKKE
jgi:hypothetical protein